VPEPKPVVYTLPPLALSARATWTLSPGAVTSTAGPCEEPLHGRSWSVTSDDARFGELLTGALSRPVTLASAAPSEPSLEEYWPDTAELDHQETVTDEAMPASTFFDLAAIHVLTTATINRLRELYPQGRFEVRRFRPNIVGDDVVLEITDHCPRCVMTTLPQEDLPKDSGILRTAARHNEVHVGVYGEVRRGGRIQRGDTVTLG
jgi:uncharacterized protein YcbX